jgi:hypothetical protein
MAISKACARSCWQINRVRLNLIGASLLSPSAVQEVLRNLSSNTGGEGVQHVLKDQILHEIPPVRELTSNGAVIARNYSSAELAVMPLERRFDSNAVVTTTLFSALIVGILQVCAASEAYLVNILDWVVMRNPRLMMKKDAELRITLSTVLDATDHTALLETLRTAVIGSVVKGRCWKDKLKNFTVFLDLKLAKHPVSESLDKKAFELRNVLSHQESPHSLDFGFIQPGLKASMDGSLESFHMVAGEILRFALDVRGYLYAIDQEVGRKHLSRGL